MFKPARLGRRARAILAGVLVFGLFSATGISVGAQNRIVAVGDVHGAFPEFESILRQTGLIDAKSNARGWTGGDTVFVQLGDVIDRGAGTRDCLNFMMDLERSAQKQKKGKVVALLGNHEVMAMMGDFRYVGPEDYASFATKDSDKVRQAAYADYLSFVAADQNAGVQPAEKLSPEKWMAEHPPGYFERRDAFGPQGIYGKWLRPHDVLYKSGDIVFVHGGLSPNLAFDKLSDLNDEMRGALREFDRGWQSLVKAGVIWKYMSLDEAVVEIQRERAAIPERETENTKLKDDLEKFLRVVGWLIADDNPTWYRGLAEQPEQTLGPRVDMMFAKTKINYLVVAHTPQADFQIHQRFGNRVFLIDTGMLRPVFGGRASALEIKGGRFTAYYLDQAAQILASREDTGKNGARPDGTGRSGPP